MFSTKHNLQKSKTEIFPDHKRWNNQVTIFIKHLNQIKNNIDNYYLQNLWKLKDEINELTVTDRDPEKLKHLKIQYDLIKPKLIAETLDEKFVASLKEKFEKKLAAHLSLKELLIKTQCVIYLLCKQNYNAILQNSTNLNELNASLHKVVNIENYSRYTTCGLPGLNSLYAEFCNAISAFTNLTVMQNLQSNLSFPNDIRPTPVSPKIVYEKCSIVKGSLGIYQQLDYFLQKNFSPNFLAGNICSWLYKQATQTHQRLEFLRKLILENPGIGSEAIFRSIPLQDSEIMDYQYLRKLENWAETCIIIIKRKITFVKKKSELFHSVQDLFADILEIYSKASNSPGVLRPFIGAKLQIRHLTILAESFKNEKREHNKNIILALQALLKLLFTIQDSKHYLAFDFPVQFKFRDHDEEDDEFLITVKNWANRTTSKLLTVAPTLSILKNKYENAHAKQLNSGSKDCLQQKSNYTDAKAFSVEKKSYSKKPSLTMIEKGLTTPLLQTNTAPINNKP